MRPNYLPILAFALLLALVAAPPVSAGYIDPNTGGLLFQVLAVAFTFLSGIVLLFAGKIRQLAGRLLRRRRESEAAEPSPPESGGET